MTSIALRVIFKQLMQTSGVKEQEVKMVIVHSTPGDSSSAHRHPIPTFGYILKGKLASTFDGQVYRYKPVTLFMRHQTGCIPEQEM